VGAEEGLVVVGAFGYLRGAAHRPEPHAAGGSSDVSVFADASHLGLLVAMSGMAAISGLVLAKSIEEEDSGMARIWASLFAATSLVAAWSFGRLV
jgi:hypothetical protein